MVSEIKSMKCIVGGFDHLHLNLTTGDQFLCVTEDLMNNMLLIIGALDYLRYTCCIIPHTIVGLT